MDFLKAYSCQIDIANKSLGISYALLKKFWFMKDSHMNFHQNILHY